MCVCYTREHGEKRGIHVGVYLSFGQIQPGAASLAAALRQTPAAPVPPASHTHTVHTPALERTHNTNFATFTHTHTHIPVHPSCIKVCLSFPAHRFRSSQSRYFPFLPTDIHTHTHTQELWRGGRLWAECVKHLH